MVVSGIAEVRSSSFTLGFVPADVTLLLFYSLSCAVPSTFHLFHVCVHGTKPRDIKKEVKYLILLSPNYKESFFRAKFPPNLMLFSIYLLSFIFSDSFFAFIKECVPVTLKDHFHIHTFFCTFANQTQM